jgi:hypothetical protein
VGDPRRCAGELVSDLCGSCESVGLPVMYPRGNPLLRVRVHASIAPDVQMNGVLNFQIGMPVCWVFQAVAGVAVTRTLGRIVGFSAGYVHIRIFDTQANGWVERTVEPITLRQNDPRAAALLGQQEAAFPAPAISASPVNGSKIGPAVSGLQRPLREIVELRPTHGSSPNTLRKWRRRAPQDTGEHGPDSLVAVARLQGGRGPRVRVPPVEPGEPTRDLE